MKFFIFDILYLEGKDLINVPLSERKQILAKVLPETNWSILAPYLITDQAEELHRYHQQKLAEGLEGAVIKQIDSIYQSGRKGWTWVKIKEEEGSRGKLNDTLDLVVMGYYFGKGKRHGFGVGAFLAGVPDNEGNFLTISKVGTGLSDEQFKELKQKSAPLEVKQAPVSYKVEKIIAPDVWLAPELVAEIAADEMTKS
ncbi:MAG: DNA ligase, partial [Epsilonproteobacteria bacterium]|nr:DNA ligase [Campylobacterota bacterium]